MLLLLVASSTFGLFVYTGSTFFCLFQDGKKVEGFCGLDTTLINESEGLFFSGTSRKDGKVSSVCRLGCQPVPGGAIPLIVL